MREIIGCLLGTFDLGMTAAVFVVLKVSVELSQEPAQN